jgi:hypothetical protein
MANDAAGASWTEGEPGLTDPRYLGQQEIRGLRVGLRKRLEYEHETPAAGTTGCEHKQGSAKAYVGAEPSLRPDGVTSLDADDEGRLLVDTERVLKHYDDTEGAFVGVVGAAAEGNTSIKAAGLDTAAGWTNDTGYPVLVNVSASYTLTIACEVNYGAGWVTMMDAVQTGAGTGRFVLFCTVILPNGAKIRLNPSGVATGKFGRYQDLTTP